MNWSRRKRRNPEYTDDELIAFLSDGKEISAWELQYAFGGSSAGHARRLKKLEAQGILQFLREGKYGNIYSLADNVE